MKEIVLNKTSRFRVKTDEYNRIEHPQYQHLNILHLFGFHERLISLIEELSYLFAEKVNLQMSNVTHGGYIPIQCSPFFKNIYTHYTNDQEPMFTHNVKYHSVSNIQRLVLPSDWIVVNFDQPDKQIIISPQSNLCNSMNVYSLSNVETKYTPQPNLYLYVADAIHDAFINRFRMELDDHVLTYDNLLHLCIMVKNGGTQFENTLIKNRNLCDRWTVLDTGSTDQSVEVVHNTLVGKRRGDIYEEPFINFRDSRNRCLDLAGRSCKFIITMDDTYTIDGDLREFLQVVRGDQYADSYSLYVRSDDTKYVSNRIIKSATGLRYMFRIHEVISDKNNINVVVPENDVSILDGRFDYMEERTMARKQLDLKLLFEEVEEDPNNPRSYYYLAQTYSLLKQYDKAFEYFMKRASYINSGFIQERIDSIFEAARLANFHLKKPWPECLALYEAAYKIDESRPDSLYFIGIHYYLEGNHNKAYSYFKKGFQIGYPLHCQYSLKPTLSYHFLPKFLTKICYTVEDYVTGEAASALFLQHNKQTAEDYGEMLSWHLIFKKLNQVVKKDVSVPEKPIFCFVADGGFAPWSGRNILTSGVGGSETYIIEMARYIQRDGRFQVFVFCNCPENDTFEGVQYRHLNEYPTFIHSTYVHTSIISRFTEYLPVTFKGYAENVYLVLHDLTPSGNVIPVDKKLKKVFCLTDWHVQYFLQHFPVLKEQTVSFSYGIDSQTFDVSNKKKYQFIYSSFPNRGLLPLLQMWPSILQIQPLSTLHIYADVDGKWVNDVAADQMREIRRLLAEYGTTNNIHYHGWVDKKTLASAWSESDIWFYPCIFMETFCLTALEAARSKTLVITNNLAALQNTVGDRGIVIPIERMEDVMTKEWQTLALDAMKPYLTGTEDEAKRLIERNYEWAAERSWENRAKEMLSSYVLTQPYQYKGMYNWTNDLPEGSKDIFIDMINQFNKNNSRDNPRVLEIGTYTGMSLIELMKRIPGSIGTAIDPWVKYDENGLLQKMGDLKVEESFYHNVEVAKLTERVKVRKGESSNILIDMIKNGEMFDFIYVDGSHLMLDCHVDLILSFQVLEKGGMMVIDDYLYNIDKPLESPFEGVNRFLVKMNGRYQLINKGYRVFLVKIC